MVGRVDEEEGWTTPPHIRVAAFEHPEWLRLNPNAATHN